MDQELTNKQRRNHKRVWNMIFKDQTWLTKVINEYKLNPILIGPDLIRCYNNNPLPSDLSLYSNQRKQYGHSMTYLVLVIEDTLGKLQSTIPMFLSCLREYRFEKYTDEIWITSDSLNWPTIKLNAFSLLHSSKLIRLKVTDLFPFENKDLLTFYLFKKDNTYALKTSEPENFFFKRVKASCLENLEDTFILVFALPNGQQIQQRFSSQISIENPYFLQDYMFANYDHVA